MFLCAAGGESWSPPLELARVCQFEASFSRADCAAIFWVIYKRAGATDRQWLDVLHDQSALYAGSSPRARAIASYPWGDAPGATDEFNRAWENQCQYAIDIFLGTVADPCPTAAHWAGRTDPPPTGFIEVACREPTVNLMYRVGGRARP